jgi:hypothetical protein
VLKDPAVANAKGAAPVQPGAEAPK